MRTALDTNVISALWSAEPLAGAMADWLNEARRAGRLVICAPVMVELRAYPGATEEFVTRFLHDAAVEVDRQFSPRMWDEVGQAFATYADRRRRSSGGQPKRLLVDFMVGAHALIAADRLLTLDVYRYRQDFPGLVLPLAPL